MAQVFQVLQCYKCETFQIQQIKKAPKWECKICCEKQSVKKVFGTGTGKECRLLVQENNAKRMNSMENEVPSPKRPCNSQSVTSENMGLETSKWTQFMNPFENKEEIATKTEEHDNTKTENKSEEPPKKKIKCDQFMDDLDELEMEDKSFWDC